MQKYFFLLNKKNIFVQKFYNIYQCNFILKAKEMTRVIDLINELKKKCMVTENEFIKENRISDSEYNFFIAFASNDSFDSKLIAQKMNLSLSRVSRVVDKMVKNGYIERKIDLTDRRTICLNLTEKGILLSKEIENYRKKCEQIILENIPEHEIIKIKEGFTKIIEVL